MEGEGQKPVHFAARYNRVDVLEELYKRGAKIDDEDDCTRTPLFLAAASGKENLELVLRVNVDLYIRN